MHGAFCFVLTPSNERVDMCKRAPRLLKNGYALHTYSLPRLTRASSPEIAPRIINAVNVMRKILNPRFQPFRCLLRACRPSLLKAEITVNIPLVGATQEKQTLGVR